MIAALIVGPQKNGTLRGVCAGIAINDGVELRGYKIMEPVLTQKRLKELLRYCPETGIFTRRTSPANNVRTGDIAGCNNGSGYLVIGIDNIKYFAHRLAFLYIDGYLPEHQVDHFDGIRNNNKWINLRHASQSCNMQNLCINSRNITGFPGVSFSNVMKKYSAHVKIDNKSIHLGVYTEKLDAALARLTAEVWDKRWTCNYRSELARAIKRAWPGFNTKSIGG